jgi:hypothetical protein
MGSLRQTKTAASLIAIALMAAVAFSTIAFAQAGNRKTIFVPKPKGDTSLDNSSGADAKGPDQVVVLSGDKLTGKVTKITQDGHLHLSAPHFEGEVRVFANKLDTLILGGRAAEAGSDMVVISNGNAITGTIVAITKSKVVMDTTVCGKLEIARNMVTSISFGEGGAGVVESQFHLGRMAPWVKAHGSGAWSIRNRALQYTGRGQHSGVAIPYDLTDAVTFEAKIEVMGRSNASLLMIIGATDKSHMYGRDSVLCNFQSYQYQLQYSKKGSVRQIRSGSYHQNRIQGKATLRIAYDPSTNKVSIWKNKLSFGEHKVPVTLGKGKYIMFGSNYSVKVHSFKIMRGIVAPGKDATETKKTEKDMLVFKNGDRVSVNDLTLGPDGFAAKTSFGTVGAPLEKIKAVSFRSKGRAKPRRQKHDVKIHTGESVITMNLAKLTPEYVQGTSDLFGGEGKPVAIRRKAIRRMQFQLYR